jgi:hypothetical protein
VPLADFTVTLHNEPGPDGIRDRAQARAVRVVVYSDIAHLRAAATRYDNRARSPRRKASGEYADTLGVCHRFEWLDAETDESQPLCAIVRLARPHLGAGIVTHELTHAAVWIRQLDQGSTPLDADHDEPLCWDLGELVRITVDALYDLGVYDDR